ncbi:MAG: hypothetical protein ACRDRK_14285 [Pseudonocardia sp.]
MRSGVATGVTEPRMIATAGDRVSPCAISGLAMNTRSDRRMSSPVIQTASS